MRSINDREQRAALAPLARDHSSPGIHGVRPLCLLAVERPAQRAQEAVRVYDAKHPLTARYDAWKKAQDDLDAEKSKAKSSAEAVLNSVTTVKKLIEVWPEVEQFARPFAVESPSRAIALPIRELNARLGLPPQTASA